MTRRPVILAVVSRGERQQDPTSQLIPLRAVAARLGWAEPIEVVLKLSRFDKKEARQVHEEALAPIRDGRADVLMVWALDRFTREGPMKALGLIEKLEKHYGASFYSMQEPILSTASDPQTRELMVSLLAWVAKWDSQRKSERLKAKAVTKRNRAGALGERAVWGLGRLASDAEVEQVHELKAAGYSVRAVAAETGLSKSQVGRILQGVPPQTAGQAPAHDQNEAPSSGGGLGHAHAGLAHGTHTLGGGGGDA